MEANSSFKREILYCQAKQTENHKSCLPLRRDLTNLVQVYPHFFTVVSFATIIAKNNSPVGGIAIIFLTALSFFRKYILPTGDLNANKFTVLKNASQSY